MAQEPEVKPNNIVNAPKSVSEMKRLIAPFLGVDPDGALAERMHALVGFQIRWKLLNVTQAAMVWLAWRTVNGDEAARQILSAMRGVQVEEREQFDPQEVRMLRAQAAEFRKLERILVTAHNPLFTYIDAETALYNIIQERNQYAQASRKAPEPVEEG